MDARADALLAPDGLLHTLGIDVREMTAERVVATMAITGKLLQPFGYLHGGASLALAESVASLGGCLNCPPGHAAFGLEVNANHIRPTRVGRLTAATAPLHVGRTTQVWDVRITDEREKLVCVARCTLAMVKVRDTGDDRPAPSEGRPA